MLRGDHELNEIKAQKLPGVASPLTFATDATIRASVACGVGSLGPIGLSMPTYVDRSARAAVDFVCGANDDGFHFRGANWERDAKVAADRVVDLRNVVEGDPSPDGKGRLSITRGIEVGHIFQLGRKYSESLDAKVLDQDGTTKTLDHGLLRHGRHPARRRDHRAVPRRQRNHLAATGRAIRRAHRCAELRQIRRPFARQRTGCSPNSRPPASKRCSTTATNAPASNSPMPT